MTDRIAELRAESRDLIALLQRLGDGEHDDLSVAHDAIEEIINLRLQRAALLDCAEALSAIYESCDGYVPNTSKAMWGRAITALARLNGADNAG